MSRYIDADAFDDTVQKLNEQGWHITRIDYKRMDRILFEMPTVDIPQWIPCSERLPEYDEEVLCFTTSEEMVVGHLEDEWGQNVWTTGEFASGTFDALAWMPLPEPYKAERREDDKG